MCGAMMLSMTACGSSASDESQDSSVPAESSKEDVAEGGDAAEEKEEGAEGGVTLTVMMQAQNAQLPYYVRMISAYEEKTGNKLDIIGIEDASFDSVATSKFATGDIPDIFVHHNNTELANYNVRDNFYYMNDQSWTGELTDEAYKNALDDEGNLLGLPFGESSVSGFYYNKTILADLGLEVPTTQKEFDVLCQNLKDAGYTPICFPLGKEAWMYQFAFDPVFADDPELLEKINKNEITYADIPQIADMCQWIKDAADKGWFGATHMGDGWDELSDIMGTGEAVIIPIWDTWFITDFDESNDYTMDDFGVMPVFMNTVEEGTYEGGNVLMIMANKNSENLDTVLEFLEFCADPEVYNVSFDGIPTTAIYKNETTNIQADMITEAKESLDACLRPSTARAKLIGFLPTEINTAVQELVMGNIDVEGCISMMDETRIETAKALGTEGF